MGIPEHLIDTVYLGDVMDLLRQLPDQSVDMVFSDPDYNVGVKYNGKSYTRAFEEYIEWYIELARESLRVLKDDGNMFFINYPKQNAHLRVRFLDEACYDVQDYVWIYNTNVGHSPKRFTTAHRSIWFYFDLVKNVSREKTFHSCQIPQKLSEMLILSCTQPGDVVLVHFGGSGAELEVCQRLGRRFLAAEIDPTYHAMILERLRTGRIHEEYRLIKRTVRMEDLSLQPALWSE
ncbi:MAG: site-specific DNA-methyltransferase [Fimbriimonadales bacterium]|nr:site-specific DNA-methyltransferase [Fimbriimonadales bacterium]